MRRVLYILLILAYFVPLALYAYIHAPGGHDGKVHLRYMAWGNPEQQATDEALLRHFEELHPNIKVDFTMAPGGPYTQKLQVMLASDTAADVFKMDLYYLPKYFPYGYFLPLNDLAAADPSFSWEDFYPQTRNELTWHGKIYGLNTLFGGKHLYYNKKLFAQAGLPDPYEQYLYGEYKAGRWPPPPSEQSSVPAKYLDATYWEHFTGGEWNLESFLKAAETLTVRGPDGRATQYGVLVDNGDLHWLLWCHDGGVMTKDGPVLIDRPESIAALRFYSDLQWKHKVCPMPGENTGGAFSFESGSVGMTTGFAGESPRFRKITSFAWDVVPVPAGPRGRASLMKGNGLIISAHTKHPKEAWELIKFLNSPEGELAYCGPKLRRGLPTRIAVSHSQGYLGNDGRPPFNTRTFLELHQSAHELPVTDRWQDWQPYFSQWMERMSLGTATPEQAARGMAADIRRVLREDNPL